MRGFSRLWRSGGASEYIRTVGYCAIVVIHVVRGVSVPISNYSLMGGIVCLYLPVSSCSLFLGEDGAEREPANLSQNPQDLSAKFRSSCLNEIPQDLPPSAVLVEASSLH